MKLSRFLTLTTLCISFAHTNAQTSDLWDGTSDTTWYNSTDVAMQELLLYDVSERILKRVSVHAAKISLDVSDLQNGIYIIKITSPDAVFVRKIQVVR
jgi:hypothetical protein